MDVDLSADPAVDVGAPLVRIAGAGGLQRGGDEVRTVLARVDHTSGTETAERKHRRAGIFVIGGGTCMGAISYHRDEKAYHRDEKGRGQIVRCVACVRSRLLTAPEGHVRVTSQEDCVGLLPDAATCRSYGALRSTCANAQERWRMIVSGPIGSRRALSDIHTGRLLLTSPRSASIGTRCAVQ